MPKEKEEKLYLKDVFAIDEYVNKGINKLFVSSGVCSGKSTWVTKVLSQKGSVLYITSRKAKVEEDMNETKKKDNSKIKLENVVEIEFKDVIDYNSTDNHTILTNSKLANEVNKSTFNHVNNLETLISLYDYIVIDEVHSIVTDSTFADSSKYMFDFIEYATEQNKVVVAMTGTPEPIQYYFENNNWTILDYRKVCNYVHPKCMKLIRRREVLKSIKETSGQIIYFANRTESIKKLCKDILAETEIKEEEISIILARGRFDNYFEKLAEDNKIGKKKTDIIKRASEETYESIIKNKMIPSNCKILISTSTLREGVDIENNGITMFCENHILSNIIQFMGRVRKSAEVVYIIDNPASHSNSKDTFLYKHAQAIVDSENSFLHNEIDVEALFDTKKLSRLIKHVTHDNPYLYYSFICKCFKVFDIRYREEERILKQKYWKKDIIKHCEEYDIKHYWFNAKENCQTILTDVSLYKNCQFFKKTQHILLNILDTAYDIDAKQPDKINRQLTEKNADIRIAIKRENVGEDRNKHYWNIYNINSCASFCTDYISSETNAS